MGPLRDNTHSRPGVPGASFAYRWGIACLVLLSVASGTSCSAGKRSSGVPGPKNAPVPAIRLDGVTFQEIKEDRTVYSGIASGAEYYDDRHTGVIMNPRLDGVLGGGGRFTAGSDRAFYYDRERVITMEDDISANLNDDYDIRCNLMDYLIDKRVLLAKAPVTVMGRDLQLYADSGSIDLLDNRLTMQGDIRAKIYNMSLK
ncbi:MAG: LPS export ABC transporter periplasmic protein LptC [Deltaproteobacteria bacterium]|nr:LPS export ABC transporter periplasmic protein LptC [Deltaproteobacteria bacterium]MCL5277058.1 LPS export ABC transporter periplasmic protein LptC [Deltaproteobacteria bacterium]